MIVDNFILKSFATGDGSLTIEAQSIDDNVGLIDSGKLSKIATKYIKARWPHERDWFLVDSFNNSVRFVVNVKYKGNGIFAVGDKCYDVFARYDNSQEIQEDDMIVIHKGFIVRFAEVVNPIRFYMNNQELFNDT